MRRSDREVTDVKLIEAFIAEEQIMRIAFYDNGEISIVDDREEKLKGLNVLMKQTSGKAEWQYSEEMVNAVAVYKVDVNEISCKAK